MRVPRDRRLVILIVIGVILAGVAIFAFVDRHPEQARVTVLDEDGTELGTVSVRVADTGAERYTGLSDTESLGPSEGMLFVHETVGEKAYVMRDMAFPIDIVFIGPDRQITAIHHAPTEEPPYQRYRGRAKWVLEVPSNWTVEHGVTIGDRIRIDWADS